MKIALLRLVGAGLMIVALTGCNQHKSPAKSTAPTTSVTSGSTASTSTAAPSATCVIPQNNGGDHDADNNGGPDDGDGCDK
jgi:hypothetical protein